MCPRDLTWLLEIAIIFNERAALRGCPFPFRHTQYDLPPTRGGAWFGGLILENYTAFLEVYIAALLGTVAFMTIVATLRLALGETLLPLQNLVVRFFVEVGLLQLILAMTALFLVRNMSDQVEADRLMILFLLVALVLYLTTYVQRRRKIKARTPLPSLLVMIGYGVEIVAFVVILSGQFWQPSTTDTKTIIQIHFIWVELSLVIVFLYFMGEFMSGTISDDNQSGENDSPDHISR